MLILVVTLRPDNLLEILSVTAFVLVLNLLTMLFAVRIVNIRTRRVRL